VSAAGRRYLTPTMPLEPVFIISACTCRKYPFAHVPAERQQTSRRMPGDRLFELLKQEAVANRAAGAILT
jgi:hypothetical protein